MTDKSQIDFQMDFMLQSKKFKRLIKNKKNLQLTQKAKGQEPSERYISGNMVYAITEVILV